VGGPVDPAGAGFYDANAKCYLVKLDALESEVKAAIAEIPAGRRKIIITHNALGYFGDADGLEIISPEGVSTEAEPSARELPDDRGGACNDDEGGYERRGPVGRTELREAALLLAREQGARGRAAAAAGQLPDRDGLADVRDAGHAALGGRLHETGAAGHGGGGAASTFGAGIESDKRGDQSHYYH